MSTEGSERYVEKETGKSTEHAAEKAKSFNEMRELQEEVKGKFPGPNTLNWQNEGSPYVVTNADTKGILEILKKNLPGSKLGDVNFVRVAYGHMFKKVNQEMQNGNPKIYDINFIQAGDKLWVANGKLHVKRKEQSKFADFEVNIYPWGELSPPASPPPTQTPPPSPPPEPRSQTGPVTI